MKLHYKLAAAAAIVLVTLPLGCSLLGRSERLAAGEAVGEVSTTIRFFGPNDKILISAFDDPRVKGVACHIARATTGGFWYFLGMTEDPSDASVSCRQVGPMEYDWDELVKHSGEKVLNERTSVLFKTLQVRRTVDAKRRVLVYSTNSDTLFSGSSKNSISTVALGAVR